MPAPTTKKVRCQDCHAEREIPVTETVPPGWSYLYVAARIRCPDCANELSRMNHDPFRIVDSADFKIQQMDPPVEDSSPPGD